MNSGQYRLLGSIQNLFSALNLPKQTEPLNVDANKHTQTHGLAFRGLGFKLKVQGAVVKLEVLRFRVYRFQSLGFRVKYWAQS